MSRTELVPSFYEPLVEWFLKNRRDLPWRKTSDPYKIWISEIMLQQTTVATVIDYYNRFLNRFPTVEALAAAREEEVIKLWEGLGYYRRARNLHQAARFIVNECEGVFPSTKEALLKLPGVGDYTAGAILSIAFRKSEAALDGNLIRVYARLYRFRKDVSEPASLKQLWSWAKAHKPERPEMAREFAEGMMELGALVCTPQKPRCADCPLTAVCRSYSNKDIELIPFKSKKEKRISLKEEVRIFRRNGRIGFLKKGEDPKFPHFLRLPYRKINRPPKKFNWKLSYAVTNRHFSVFVREGEEKLSPTAIKWLTKGQIEKASLPAIDRKILKKVLS